jgi:hypothetical protein
VPTITNRIATPTFENGVGGWTATAGVTLSTGTAHSLYGTKSLKVTVPAGTGTVRVYSPLGNVENFGHRFWFGMSVAASTAGINYTWGFDRLNVSLGVVNTTGRVTNSSTTSLVRREKFNDTRGSTTIKWVTPYISLTRHATLAVDWYFDGVVWLDEADQQFFPFFYTTPPPIIVGGRPDAEGLSFDWAGAAENSFSVATFLPQLSVPAQINRGDTIAVTGSGWPASSTVDITVQSASEGYLMGPTDVIAAGVPTDASGNLSTSFTVPLTITPTPTAWIAGKSTGVHGTYLRHGIYTAPSVLPSTNLFPNPNATTLNGSRPKHFIGLNDNVITQTDAGGNKRALMDTTASSGSVTLELNEAGQDFTTYGLVDGKEYLAALTLHPVAGATSGDPFAYMGDGDQGLTGTGPWRVVGHVTGPYAGNTMGMTSWDWSGNVEFDEVTLCEAATYLNTIDYQQPPDTTLDGYALGLRPGRSYQFTGYSYATYTIRTGPTVGSLTDLVSWVQARPTNASWAGSFTGVVTIPAGHEVIQIVTTDADPATITSAAGKSWWNIYDHIPYFDGDTPDDGTYTYSWAGTPGDSASIRTLAATSAVTAQVFVGGVGINVTEMRVVKAGVLVDVTEAGD